MGKTRNIRLYFSCILFLLLPFVTGCWSSHEIEELSLAVGVSLDKGEVSSVEKEIEEQGGGYSKNNNLTITFQSVNTKIAGAGSKGGGMDQKSYLNITESGDSSFQIGREIPLRNDRPMYGYHLKVIIISEDLISKYSLEELLDSYLRDDDIRPSCLVLISKNKASEALETKGTGEIPAFRLIKMVDNVYKSTRILQPMPLAKLTGKMQSGSSFLLQNVISTDGEVKFAGAAVIEGKTKKYLGTLNEEELEGITWITGKGKGGVIKTFDKDKGQLIVYEVKSMKSKIIPYINGENISFDVNIESNGRLSETGAIKENLFDNTVLKKYEKAIEIEVEHLMKSVVQKMQEDYKTDVAGFGNQLRIEHPKVWAKVKKNWDETFSNIPINYNVEITITNYGTFGS
ncbi:Ger(x)C family spore germination protein [Lysinibacillus fusiformis]|uniref:Ger(x)C family spore germination protein n=1 Tax=Lysinibacillus fusiformis TaxID=28031 RepID=UPI0023A92D00|nr:Ger(x)C family spore germination protein [Lysinibacillus fusiformis]WEA41242.1 Ger(x)C family spore germination protein [Lysinibacillus fusiformis]